MGAGGIYGRLAKKDNKKTEWESRVLDFRHGSGSDDGTGAEF